MSENEVIHTDYQKAVIYKNMLEPLKYRISQILLYDTDAAIEFLQEYNEILNNGEQLGGDIYKRITDLEFKIASYENENGGQKKVEGEAEAMIDDIEDLQMRNYQMSAQDFAIEFSELKERYSKVLSYSFQDREVVEGKFSELEIVLIGRLMMEKPDVDLKEDIPQEDKFSILMKLNEQVSSLLQSDSLKNRRTAKKLKNILITDGEDAIYSRRLWIIIGKMQKEGNRDYEVIDDEQTTELALMPIRQKPAFTETIVRFFSKKPRLPLQVQDLKKIDMEWLAEHVPQQMLEEIETERLEKEGRNPEKRFLPDPKTPIYDMIALNRWDKSVEFGKKEEYETKDLGRLVHRSEQPQMSTYQYIDSTGIKKELKIIATESDEESWIGTSLYWFIFTSGGESAEYLHDGTMFKKIIDYAQMLDNMFSTNWTVKLFSELEDKLIEGEKKYDSHMYLKR